MSTLSSRRCGIDVHAHAVPEHFPAWLGSAAPAGCAPSTAALPVGGVRQRQILAGGKHGRTVAGAMAPWRHRTRNRGFAGVEVGIINGVPIGDPRCGPRPSTPRPGTSRWQPAPTARSTCAAPGPTTICSRCTRATVRH